MTGGDGRAAGKAMDSESQDRIQKIGKMVDCELERSLISMVTMLTIVPFSVAHDVKADQPIPENTSDGSDVGEPKKRQGRARESHIIDHFV